MGQPLVPQHFGNSRHHNSDGDVFTRDRGQTVIVRLRDSEGYPLGNVRMTREAALDLIEYLTEVTAGEDPMANRKRGAWPIDATPALKAREMGCEMQMMAVPQERGYYRHYKDSWESIRLRAQARTVVKRMVEVYMTREEQGYWTTEEIQDLLVSLPANTVDAFLALPNEDIEHFFRACVDEVRSVQQQIDTIAA